MENFENDSAENDFLISKVKEILEENDETENQVKKSENLIEEINELIEDTKSETDHSDDDPNCLSPTEEMHKLEENNLEKTKKLKKETQKFPKNKILKILKELNLNYKNTELISCNLELILKNLIKTSISKAVSKGRKTLFIEDLKESIKELKLFYLYDLINEKTI